MRYLLLVNLLLLSVKAASEDCKRIFDFKAFLDAPKPFVSEVSPHEWKIKSPEKASNEMPAHVLKEEEVEGIRKEMCSHSDILKNNKNAQKLASRLSKSEDFKRRLDKFQNSCFKNFLGTTGSFILAWPATVALREMYPETIPYLEHSSNFLITFPAVATIHKCLLGEGANTWLALASAVGGGVGLNYYTEYFIDQERNHTKTADQADLNSGIAAAVAYAAMSSWTNSNLPAAFRAFCKK